MKILIGGAWPYANGSLHIGHIAALLPGDVLARYHRAKGDNVTYVSGSDCHGTPVAIKAKQLNKIPHEISDYYHTEFCECFNKLGFSYDLYTKTSSEEHIAFVKEFHKRMYQSEYIYEKSLPQAYCDNCSSYLADRFVVGKCPNCGENARGDQCDACGKVLEPEMLCEPECSICGNKPTFKDCNQLYIALSKLEERLKNYVADHPDWRKNAISFTNKYITEGLRDRAITRNLDWGINVPYDGYEDKKIYIWAENVLGYLSASKAVTEKRKESFEELWGKDAKHYYIHGKDNIPFHTIILPALLLANGGDWHLPDEIISSDYLTLEGRKISTSQNWAVWVKDIINKYNPDSIRYFLISNGPERRDTDFTWNEYINSHNGELLGAYGNFVNRSLCFIAKYFDYKVPVGIIDNEIQIRIINLYSSIGIKIENGSFKDAINDVFEFIRFSNKYFDNEKPWLTRTTDNIKCSNALYNCTQIIANLSVLLKPFLPFSSQKIYTWLGIGDSWDPKYVESGFIVPEPEILFERINKKVIDEEIAALRK